MFGGELFLKTELTGEVHFHVITSQIISGSAPVIQPTNRGRAESRDVDAKRQI